MSHVDEGMLHAYIDGELPPAEAQGVAEHLAHCPVCRGRVEEERPLIARADQVLALARPPERDVPAFQAGARQPPDRRWWKVRVPLAWAATVVLALGIGIYVGRAGPGQAVPPVVGPSPMPRASHATAAESTGPSRRQVSAPARTSAAGRAPVVGPTSRQPTTGDLLLPSATLARDKLAAKVAINANAEPAAERVFDANAVTRQGDVVLVGAPLSLDSARALLDADPFAVPGVAVRAIYQGLMPGYSVVVVVEQVLDSGTTLAVITARPAALALGEVRATGVAGAAGAAGAARPAAASPTARVDIAGQRTQDSVAGSTREPRARAAPRPNSPRAGLWVDVRGPLAADSLAALGRRLEPLRP